MEKRKGIMKKILIAIMVFAVLFSASALADEPARILTNSQDWKDVYSVMLYGSLLNKNTNFLVSERHANIILGQIPNSEHLWVFTSTRAPFVLGYEAFLKSRSYSVEEFRPANINLDMAERTGVKNFIIVDDSYGYNAISVAPYAVASSSFVIFADENNANTVTSFLNEQGAQEVMIYGQVNREVKDALAQFSPEIINKGGDRFANNIEIVKRYQDIKHAKQAILTNGEFIEKEIMSGIEPVIFIGTDYVKGSDIQVGILIGNELVGTATFIRRQIGISVFVKFAQGSRQPQGAISQVEALDMFYLPVYNVNLEFDSMKYNRATNKLEVTLKNTQDQAAYFIGTYTLVMEDGTRIAVGDTEPVFIDGNELKTLIYDAENLPEGQLQASIFIIYGESVNSLEKTIERDIGSVETVRVIDNCQVAINSLSLNARRSLFYVEIENTGAATCYVDLELVDVVVAGESYIMGHEGVEKLEPGEKKSLKVKGDPQLIAEDIEDNPEVKVRAFYGERETSLVKVIEGTFELVLSKGDYVFYTLIAIIILLILLILWKRRKKKKEEHAAHHHAEHHHTEHHGEGNQ